MTCKFRASFIPAADQVPEIKGLITERERKIRAVEEEVLELQERLAILNAGKEQLHAQLEARRGFIAPMRRLHPEILQEIFRHCLPVVHNAVVCSGEAPLLLGHVCSSWRRLAAESPELWTSINIVIPPHNPVASYQKVPPLEEITTWLSRSGALPLSISLSSSYSPLTQGESLDPIHARYINALSAFKSRWRSIWINIPTFSWPNYFFSSFSASDVPLLEQIHIQGPRALDSPSLINGSAFNLKTVMREDSILRAPRLRSISVLPFGHEILQLSLNWENITELNLSWNVFHCQEITRVLLLCPNLKACLISSVDPKSFDPNEGFTDISLPKLLSLSIIDESDTESDISRLLKGLHAPNLRHFAYERRPHWPPPGDDGYLLDDTVDSLAIFFKRLIHPLEEFELATDSILHSDVMRILSLVPGVKRLSLKGIGRPMDASGALPSYRDLVPVFLFRNTELRKLTPGRGGYVPSIRPRGSLALSMDSSDSDGGSDSDSDDHHHHPTLSSNRPETGTRPTCLCPCLEVIHFSGSMFSDSTMLEFLKARTIHHQKHNVAKLQKASIAFVSGKEQDSGTEAEIEELEKETSLRVNIIRYEQTKPRVRPKRWDYSPYEGLDPIPGWGSNDYRYRQRTYFGFE